MFDYLELPPRPNLAQYKKLAKELKDACESADGNAVREWAAKWAGSLARAHGRTPIPQAIKNIERRWQEFKTASDSPCALTRSQLFIAREHGFASWPKFAAHVEELSRANSGASVFEAAADAITVGDVALLQRLLRENPALVHERSAREHRSTLLHYVSANGLENYRQKTPANIVEIAKVLLDAGTAVDAESDAYGGHSTTLGLVATSVHPERAGVQQELMQLLLDRGARIDHPDGGGNRHSIVKACLANGQPGAAEFLANAGATLTLETAAGVGRLAEVAACFTAGNDVAPEELGSALLYASRYGHLTAVEFLLAHGANPGYKGNFGDTALHAAAYGAHSGIVRLLLAHGAPVDAVDRRYSADPLGVALYVWSTTTDSAIRGHCYEVVAALVNAGAKRSFTDADLRRAVESDPKMMAALRRSWLE